ncbi:hypothetical protein ACIB24_03445 [Spongisporangium articulatum]|uniref:Uncharacterized protein n=1 Tax=Spongisporangium articulatum TaxID=3362603 RepID=A0ABW8AIX3_9ACTN
MGDLDHVEGGRPAPSVAARLKWSRRNDYAHAFRVVLLVAWIAMAGVFAVVGDDGGDFRGLLDGVQAGRVTQVTVEGPGLAVDEKGSAEQVVHWREGRGGWHRLYTRVRATSASAPPDYDVRDGVWRLHARDVGAFLTDRQPDLLVTRQDDIDYDTSVLAGWRVPMWLQAVVVVVQLLVLMLIIGGPEPWRATRWAWFWLFLLPPGGFLFLLLSGPTPLIPAPRDPGRRLRGGWAFVICLLAGGLDGAG